jgi:hypothetical protein
MVDYNFENIAFDPAKQARSHTGDYASYTDAEQ